MKCCDGLVGSDPRCTDEDLFQAQNWIGAVTLGFGPRANIESRGREIDGSNGHGIRPVGAVAQK